MEIVVSKCKPNYFSLAATLTLFYYSYNYIQRDEWMIALIPLIFGIIGVIHFLLLMNTPLLVKKGDTLIIKPKIPFEKKVLFLDEIEGFKSTSESQLLILMDNKSKIKLDMGGFKKNEVLEKKKYLLSLIGTKD